MYRTRTNPIQSKNWEYSRCLVPFALVFYPFHSLHGVRVFYALFMLTSVQKMFGLQNFQNLASIQEQKLSLVGLAAASCLNSPLNLSLGSSSASSTTPIEVNYIEIDYVNRLFDCTFTSICCRPSIRVQCAPGHLNANCSTTIPNDLTNNLCGSSNDGYTQMPQLILASGQLMQGVQVAQLLIPSTQGLSDFLWADFFLLVNSKWLETFVSSHCCRFIVRRNNNTNNTHHTDEPTS